MSRLLEAFLAFLGLIVLAVCGWTLLAALVSWAER